MKHIQHTPSLDLVSLSAYSHHSPSHVSPHRHSHSPYRYAQLSSCQGDFSEKANPHTISPKRSPSRCPLEPSPVRRQPSLVPTGATHPYSSHTSRMSGKPHPYSSPQQQPCSPFLGQPMPLLPDSSFQSDAPSYYRPHGLWIATCVKPWLPVIMYTVTSLAFVVAIALYKDELFTRLDELSIWLRADEHYGHAVLFLLIFVTTIPPVPLYSTLIILSGYTFGPWSGAIISYFAALSGALTVFIISRSLLRDCITQWLESYCTIRRVVCAIEKRPKLLFLIRLAPYPYNVMNCLLAASPTLTLHTYTVCTALSLFKVIIHTSLGASIHSFKDYHVADSHRSSGDENNADTVARAWTIVGVALCVLIFVYLSIVARRAVDEELLDEEVTNSDRFLSDVSEMENGRGQMMTERPFESEQLIRTSMTEEGRGEGQ